MVHETALRLRDYQTDAIFAIENDWADGLDRVACVLSTGSGKTVIFSHLIADRHTNGQTGRTVVLVHRDELAQQAVDKLTQIAPDLNVGIVKAERNDVHADVIVASVQTLARVNRREQITGVDLVICDEAHHSSSRTWVDVMTYLGCYNGVKTAGFTATLYRDRAADSGNTHQLSDVWQKVSYQRDILDMIVGGYLAPVKGKQVTVGGLDLSSVSYARGDYAEGALGEQLIDARAGQAIAAAYLEHARERQGIVFCPTVDAAHSVCSDMNIAGIRSLVVFGAMPCEERILALKLFRTGEVQVLVSCMVLTEGFDAPWASCAVIARPTTNPALYTQMVGRVLRPWPEKTDALVLDVAGASARHRLATIADLSEKTFGETINDGEDLLDAAERISGEIKERASGKLGAKDVNLFAGSSSSWLQTYKGVWFIPVREGVWFLWPDDEGTFWVGRKDKNWRLRASWPRRGLDLDYAMAFATQYAEEEDPMVARKGASWRKKKADPSEAQINAARRVGIPTEGMGKRELSDALSIHYASMSLDRHVREVQQV